MKYLKPWSCFPIQRSSITHAYVNMGCNSVDLLIHSVAITMLNLSIPESEGIGVEMCLI